MTTQVPSVDELAVVGAPPSGIGGVRFHVRRNPNRLALTFHEIATLEAIRAWPTHGDRDWSELSSAVRALAAEGRIRPKRLAKAAEGEPARVRGIVDSMFARTGA